MAPPSQSTFLYVFINSGRNVGVLIKVDLLGKPHVKQIKSSTSLFELKTCTSSISRMSNRNIMMNATDSTFNLLHLVQAPETRALGTGSFRHRFVGGAGAALKSSPTLNVAKSEPVESCEPRLPDRTGVARRDIMGLGGGMIVL